MRHLPTIPLLSSSLLLPLGLLATPLSAQAQVEELPLQSQIYSPNSQDGDSFGYRIAMDGNNALISAVESDASTGAAYFYERSASGRWRQTQVVIPPNQTGSAFGRSVDLDQKLAAVGMTGFNNNTGSVHLFERSSTGTWSAGAILKASDGEIADFMGMSVAASGNTVIAGAPGEDNPDASRPDDRSGAAYIFTRGGAGLAWNSGQKLLPPSRVPVAMFGQSVAIDGNVAVVGAPGYTGEQDRRYGAAFVFTRSLTSTQWQLVATLRSPQPEVNALFGNSVAIDNGTILVGAQGRDTSSTLRDTGAVHVFRRGNSASSWTFAQTLSASDGQATDLFGYSMDLSGDEAVIGSFPNNSGTPEPGRGKVYRFTRNTQGTWSQTQIIKPALGEEKTVGLGESVAVQPGTILVGASGAANSAQNETGSFFVFSKPVPKAAPLVGFFGLGLMGLGLLGLGRKRLR